MIDIQSMLNYSLHFVLIATIIGSLVFMYLMGVLNISIIIIELDVKLLLALYWSVLLFGSLIIPESILLKIAVAITILFGFYAVNQRFRKRLNEWLIRKRLGKEGKGYKPTRYLVFKRDGSFYFEVRDCRYRNTFLVDKHGIIEKIYFSIGDDTGQKVGDKIDLEDYKNVSIPYEVEYEMQKYHATRNYLKCRGV